MTDVTPSALDARHAASLPGPEWLKRRRTLAYEELCASPMPSEKEEVWRYTPIDDLRLEDYGPGPDPAPSGSREARAYCDALVKDVTAGASGAGVAAVVETMDGVVLESRHLHAPLPAGVSVGGLDVLGDERDVVGAVLRGSDALTLSSDAFHPGVVVVDVPARRALHAPVVIVHWCTGEEGAASFPRTVVRVGDGSQVEVIEVVAGPLDARRTLVVPVTELSVGDGAQLSYVGLQTLSTSTWHIARLAATSGRDATLRTFTAGLGGSYDRSRIDATAEGQGASTEIRSAYLGTGSQIHDVRTLQDHVGARTTSDLLCKGAVADTSRSVYSGLIRVRRGAVRTDAFQTNHNLVLADGAHADSVPNLDIAENDVRCSHASTVGPVDEDQLYYLESRGIPPSRAQRLVVLGFFEDIVQRSPVTACMDRLRREVGGRIAGALMSETEETDG